MSAFGIEQRADRAEEARVFRAAGSAASGSLCRFDQSALLSVGKKRHVETLGPGSRCARHNEQVLDCPSAFNRAPLIGVQNWVCRRFGAGMRSVTLYLGNL